VLFNIIHNFNFLFSDLSKQNPEQVRRLGGYNNHGTSHVYNISLSQQQAMVRVTTDS